MNHLWQSTLFAGLAALLTLVLRGNPARTRYWLWFAASAKFLIPFSLLVALGQQVHLPAAPVEVVAPAETFKIPVLLEQIAQPIPTPSASDPWAPVAFYAPPVTAPSTGALDPDVVKPGTILLAIWIAGFLFVTLRWGREWLRLRSILSSGRPFDVGLPLKAVVSPTLREPGVFGIFRPALLLPEGILGSLAPEELRAILLHEMTHVRRRDNLFAAIHMATEAIFWFHPLVWWIGRRMIAERERACDEAVLQAGNEPSAYAEGILKVCEHNLESPLACAAGVTGGALKQRIHEIMQHRIVRSLNIGKKALLLAAGTLAIALPITVGVAVNLLHPAQAKAQAAKAQAIPPPPAQPAAATPISVPREEVREMPAQQFRQAFTESFDQAIKPLTQAPVLLAQAPPPVPRDLEWLQKIGDGIQKGIKEGSITYAQAQVLVNAAIQTAISGQTQISGSRPGTYVVSLPGASRMTCAQQVIRLKVDQSGNPITIENIPPPTPFDVVSIGPHVRGSAKVTLNSPNAISGNQASLRRIFIADLIADAYCVQPDQVVLGSAGAALWDEQYDLTATIPGDLMRAGYVANSELIRGMLQIALKDRFHLKMSRGTADRSVYNLTVAKGGLKMQPVATGDNGSPANGNMRQSFAELLWRIGLNTNRPVVDQTGLFGIVEYSIDFRRALAQRSATNDIFSAVQEYLGLKLEPAKLTVPTLIVDSVEKPTEN